MEMYYVDLAVAFEFATVDLTWAIWPTYSEVDGYYFEVIDYLAPPDYEWTWWKSVDQFMWAMHNR